MNIITNQIHFQILNSIPCPNSKSILRSNINLNMFPIQVIFNNYLSWSIILYTRSNVSSNVSSNVNSNVSSNVFFNTSFNLKSKKLLFLLHNFTNRMLGEVFGDPPWPTTRWRKQSPSLWLPNLSQNCLLFSVRPLTPETISAFHQRFVPPHIVHLSANIGWNDRCSK